MSLSRRQWITLAGGALIASRANAIGKVSEKTGQVKSLSGRAFGSDWHLTVSSNEDFHMANFCVEKAVKTVNQSMSPYLSTSELSMFNRLSSNAWCDVSTHFSQVLNTAMRVARLTSNAFDPTLGPVVNRFGFGPINGTSVTGVNHIDVRNNRVRKLHSNITLDLCGIAKGYAIDLAAGYLLQQGIENYLLEMGGELCAQGIHPANRQWMVAVEEPIADSNALQTLLPLNRQSIATSGVRHNAYTVDRRRYSHLIDSRTLQPVSHRLASVTVLAESAMLADAWSTALMVLGEEQGPVLAQTRGINALFLGTDQDPLTGRLIEQRTGYFPAQTG